MRTGIAKSLGSALLVSLLLLGDASAGGHRGVATDSDYVAIQGYDTVAYFTDGKAIKGSETYEYAWDDAQWHFVSAAHREMFIAEPERYMPRFGGYCAGAMMDGILVPANPRAWAIVDGKLYMIAGDAKDIDEWKVDAASNIGKANQNWPSVQSPEAPK
jgi:hypothetical protein